MSEKTTMSESPAKAAARAWLHSYGVDTSLYTSDGGDHPAMRTLPQAFENFARSTIASGSDRGDCSTNGCINDIAMTANGGWVLVPRNPTPDMIKAAHWALFRWREASGDPQREASRDEKHAIRWAAMVDAAYAKA